MPISCKKIHGARWSMNKKSGEFVQRVSAFPSLRGAIHTILCKFGAHDGYAYKTGIVVTQSGRQLKGTWILRRCKWCFEVYTTVKDRIQNEN